MIKKVSNFEKSKFLLFWLTYFEFYKFYFYYNKFLIADFIHSYDQMNWLILQIKTNCKLNQLETPWLYKFKFKSRLNEQTPYRSPNSISDQFDQDGKRNWSPGTRKTMRLSETVYESRRTRNWALNQGTLIRYTERNHRSIWYEKAKHESMNQSNNSWYF